MGFPSSLLCLLSLEGFTLCLSQEASFLTTELKGMEILFAGEVVSELEGLCGNKCAMGVWEQGGWSMCLNGRRGGVMGSTRKWWPHADFSWTDLLSIEN